MSILEKLKEDHNSMRELLIESDNLLKKFPDINKDDIDTLTEKIIDELRAHNQAEEEVFYDALWKKDKSKLLPYESFAEHGLAMNLLEELRNADLDTGELAGKLMILRKIVSEHIEEEESKVFNYANECFSSKELEELGMRFEQEKEKIVRSRS